MRYSTVTFTVTPAFFELRLPASVRFACVFIGNQAERVKSACGNPLNGVCVFDHKRLSLTPATLDYPIADQLPDTTQRYIRVTTDRSSPISFRPHASTSNENTTRIAFKHDNERIHQHTLGCVRTCSQRSVFSPVARIKLKRRQLRHSSSVLPPGNVPRSGLRNSGLLSRHCRPRLGFSCAFYWYADTSFRLNTVRPVSASMFFASHRLRSEIQVRSLALSPTAFLVVSSFSQFESFPVSILFHLRGASLFLSLVRGRGAHSFGCARFASRRCRCLRSGPRVFHPAF